VEHEQQEQDYITDYQEEEQDYYYDNPPMSGVRERELLCPIIEEDNESTASGSISNLSTQHTVIGVYSPDDPLLLSDKGEVQDGFYFIKVLENEIFKFEEQICDFEEDLNSGTKMPEDIRDSVLAAVGKAKLLMAQKLTQFRGLCDKNIHVSREEDPFVPTCQDLAGFWDMVSIQVEHIHSLFAELVLLRQNGWKHLQPIENPVKSQNNKTKSKKNVGINKPTKPKEKSEAAKARDESRRKMLEERKRAMKEKQHNKASDDLIIIM